MVDKRHKSFDENVRDIENREQCMKTNVSKDVKDSYTPELRKQRSKDNVRVWDSMSEQEKKNRCMPGLLVMHSRKKEGC